MKERKKIIKALLVVIALTVVWLSLPNLSANNNHSVTETFDGSWKAVAGNVGLYGNASRFRIDGQVGWCLEPRKGARPGLNQEFDMAQIGISIEQSNVIGLISNFGYFVQPTPTNEILTGNLIWRYLGNTCGYVSASNGYPTLASQQGWFDEVMNKVNRYGLNTSFDKGSFEINAGQTITLDDTNGVLQDMQVVSSDGLQVSKNGNQLVITGTANASDSSQINLRKVTSNEFRKFVVRNGNSQTLSSCGIDDPLVSKLTFKVNKNYQVAFNGNGATSGSMENQTFLYEQAQNLSANAFLKLGHTFNGWNTAPDGSGDNYGNQQNVKNIAAANSTLTLYAKWLNTQPNINTPILPNPNLPGISNIAPIIEGSTLVIQVGDKLDVKKYFSASDKEDGDITSRIEIVSNPVPLDKNNNTTTSGTYVVQAKVTDLGGLTATANLTILVNEPPTLTAEDRWFLQDEVVDKNNLVSQVTASDKEEGNIIDKVIIDSITYQDGKVVNNPVSFDTSFVHSDDDETKTTTATIQYTVSDKYNKSVTAVAKLHVSRDIQKYNPKRKKEVRYIDLKNINTLDKTSIWKVDNTYHQRLLNSLKRNGTKQAKAMYQYNSNELSKVKDWVRNNQSSKEVNQMFINTYLNTHKVNGSLE